MYNSIQQELDVINECTKKLDKMFGDEDIIDFGHMGSRGHKKHCWPSAEDPRSQQVEETDRCVQAA